MTHYHIERKLTSGNWDTLPNTYPVKSSAQEALEHIATVYPDSEVRVVRTSRETVDKITPQA